MQRRPRARVWLLAAALFVVALLAACGDAAGPQPASEGVLDDFDIIEDTNLSEFMLTGADPADAVAYFRRALDERAERIELRRGLATSLARADRHTEALAAWRRVLAHDAATRDDRVSYADALIRTNDWDAAAEQLAQLPPTFESFDRYRLEAMIADSREQWQRADSFYETAAGLTTRPAGVLNNWGFSKLTRGDAAEAERLFLEALQYDPSLFAAKNNLVMARAAQRNYALPMIDMSQTERAQLLHTLALTALRQNDVTTARSLLQEAVDTHPRHFDVAARALQSLDGQLIN